MGTVRVAMTADNPYHHVFEQAGDYFEIIDVESEDAGKALVTEDKADGFLEKNLDVVVGKTMGIPQSALKKCSDTNQTSTKSWTRCNVDRL